MKLGIIGLPQTGKKTLFELITGTPVPSGPADAQKSLSGVASIRDARFDDLVRRYNPRKQVPARIDLELLPKLEDNTIREGAIFRDIATMDALCHVVRAFDSGTVYHARGSVDPLRDIEAVNAEMSLHDLLFIEKRLERIAKSAKKKDDATQREEELLLAFRAHLETDVPLRTMEIAEADRKVIVSYPLITLKKLLVVLNVSDGDAADGALLSSVNDRFAGQRMAVMQVSAKLEAEIAALESATERAEFMRDAGIAEPALEILSRLAMEALGLMSFFTVGSDEVKQWLITRGSTAPEAAGAIHSDIQRGFIRAEVIKYRDLVELGSEDAIKKAGKLGVMGKDYAVDDGDIINFRFNV